MAALPYENTSAGTRALDEIHKILLRFGCTSFGTEFDVGNGSTIVHFRWRNRSVRIPASWDGYAQAWLKRHPYSARARTSRDTYESRAREVAQSAVCSILRDAIKAQVTAIECGVLEFEEAFFPHFVTASGERVIDAVRRNTNLLPAPTTEAVLLPAPKGRK